MRWFRTESGLVARQLGREDIEVREYDELKGDFAGDGDMTGGLWTLVVYGKTCTLYFQDVTSLSDTGPSSGQTIPEEYRPGGVVGNIYSYSTGSSLRVVFVSTGGNVTFQAITSSFNITAASSYFTGSISWNFV